MSYRIITDSCCDFNQQMYKKLNVACVPLSVTYKGESYNNFSEDKAVRKFYNELRTGTQATTAAANPESWRTVMEAVLKKGEDVLCIAFSSALSTTYQSAVIAAQELREEYPNRKIRVVDSLCAALGQGLLVWHACKKQSQGMELEELTAWVEDRKLHICHEVTVDDLDTLKRGGRINAATAFVGTMLNIKPMIHVSDEGKLVNYAKCRGRKAAMEHIVDAFCKKSGSQDNETVFIGHGDCPEDAKALEAMLKAKAPQVKNVYTGYVGPVIGAHTGPGVLVLFFLGDHR